MTSFGFSLPYPQLILCFSYIEDATLNREMITFPDEVTNCTESIEHRLETAGLQRKIGKNQVRTIHILLTGSYNDMKQIKQAGA